MEGFSLVDIYSTKGIEYLIAAVFFFGFLALQRYILTTAPGKEKTTGLLAGLPAWFGVPEGYGFHQGHTWMKVDLLSPDRRRLVKVGLDDFAQKLIGKVDAVELPAVGSRLTQGDKGWSLKVDSVEIPMLSPVDGEVVAVNQEVLRSPEILSRDPYGAGWLLKVKSDRLAADTRNLLSGKVARAWMEASLDNLHPIRHEALGPVLQDGGLPLEGIARVLGGDEWADLAKTHLLTDGE
ncbi:MAG TPA: glycine cleavage system protein H [Candidatus Deferrimicrobium sp.]